MSAPQYSKPADQIDLEERQAEGYIPPSVLGKSQDAEPSDNGFIGVDPAYQNFATIAGKPFRAESGPGAKVEDLHYTDDVDFNLGATAEGDVAEGPDEDDDDPVVPAPPVVPGPA